MERVKSGELKLVNAAVMMGLSYRQTKRLAKRYREVGAKGLKHASAGRESNRRKPRKFRERVLRLVGKKYSGEEGERFGPTLAAEHLASDDQVEVHAQTLRRWMLSEGLWSRARKRRVHRRRRERKQHVGELVQMDGSFHDWLEGRGPRGCLMNMVDDASGDTLARMGSEETIWAAAGVLRAWVKKYGVPVALYTDWKNVYVREASRKEQLQGVVPVTQFGQMCQRLGIRIMAANSPQAKGRVERNHGTHQDRLVKKMRLKKNPNACRGEWISGEGISARAQSAVSAYPGAARELSSSDPAGSGVGGSVSSGNRASHRQRLGGAARQPIFPGEIASPAECAGQGQVTVCEWEDGRLQIRYRGRAVVWEEIPGPVPVQAVRPREATAKKQKPPTPKADHPWRQDYRKMRPWSKPGTPPVSLIHEMSG
jgi:hypothetical protein